MTILVGYTRTAEGHAALRHGVVAAGSTGSPLAVFRLEDKAPAADDPALAAALEGGATLLQRDPQGRHAAA
ncbi:hypothetical protein HER39_18025, partial [Arthrobacter deserti]|nr:hypothetical protein [Arthrobacter deserti]